MLVILLNVIKSRPGEICFGFDLCMLVILLNVIKSRPGGICFGFDLCMLVILLNVKKFLVLSQKKINLCITKDQEII